MCHVFFVDVGDALVELDSPKSLELCCAGGVDLDVVRFHSPVVLELLIIAMMMMMISEHYPLVELEPVCLDLLVVLTHDGVCSQGC